MKSLISHRATVAAMTVFMVAGTLNFSAPEANAGRFGFRGGFRGGFGSSSSFRGGRSGFRRSNFGRSSFGRGFSRSSFGQSRFGSFRRSGFRGINGFRRSRFNSLAFRGRRFGSRGFRGFNRSARFRSFGLNNRRSFARFSPGFSTFSVGHFPTQRFHSGFASFQSPSYSSRGLVVNPVNTFAAKPVFVQQSVSGSGWNQLVQNQPVLASQTFANRLDAGQAPGFARVGFALAAADSGNLDQGVWAMRRAFSKDSGSISSMMLEEELRPTIERVTRAYEERMTASGNKADDAFMLAAMYQMQGDPEMAGMAMDYIKRAGSFDEGSKNLKELISEEMASVPMTTSAGWKLLANGQYKEARDSFIQEIGKDTKAGVPKLGFALAAAAMNDLDTGTWAMQRAFEMAPDDVSDVMLDGKLRPMVRTLIEKYEVRVPDPTLKQDDAMTLATLYQLQGDVEAAEMMVEKLSGKSEMFVAKMVKEEMQATETMMEESMKPAEQEPLTIPYESLDFNLADPPLPEINKPNDLDGFAIPPAPGELPEDPFPAPLPSVSSGSEPYEAGLMSEPAESQKPVILKPPTVPGPALTMKSYAQPKCTASKSY